MTDWPCKLCKKSFKNHVQIGDLNEDNSGLDPASHNFCFTYKSCDKTPKFYWQYIPEDNLKYLEMKAAGEM